MPESGKRAAAESSARRAVVPAAAGRSLWLAALWTGAGVAVLCATLAIIAVAICWLPVSGSSGRAHSAIHAGLLTFLAALHGGITVDGDAAAFLPLGLTLIVAAIAWRAGSGLADAATALGERDPARLALAGAVQAGSFAACCLIAVPFAALGTSEAPFLGVGAAALLLFAVAGGTALVRNTPLRAWCAERLPDGLPAAARGTAVVLAVYAAAAALLVAASLVLHHGRVTALSAELGGGWGGIPVLLLGILAAPNAIVAGASYLAGPGFAVGSGTTVSALSTGHGVLPAFPVLGALPDGHGANAVVWCLMVLTAVVAAASLVRVVRRTPHPLRQLATVFGLLTLALVVLGWQAGGGIGAGRLSAIGPSPWQFALALAAVVTALAGAGLGALALAGRLRGRLPAVRDVVTLRRGDGDPVTAGDDAERRDRLAG